MADQASEGALSPFLKSQRIKACVPYLKGRVLDVGCGTGTLAGFLNPNQYVGFDIDKTSLNFAASNHPSHLFVEAIDKYDDEFDTIVSLAVIEHVKDPENFLKVMHNLLKKEYSSKLVLTTPNPKFEKFHDIGSVLGLFSQSANEEHEQLIDLSIMQELCSISNLAIKHYEKFLFGANQLFVLEPKQ